MILLKRFSVSILGKIFMLKIQHLKEILKEEEFRQEKVIEEEMVHLKQIIDWMRSLYRRP